MEDTLAEEKDCLRDRIPDFSTICRFCMAADLHLKPIFADESLKENILLFTKVQIAENDDLPHNVCTKCLQNIQQCVEFKSTCEKSHECLTKMLERKKWIKEEYDNDNEISLFDSDSEKMDLDVNKKWVVPIEVSIEQLFACERCPFMTHLEQKLQTHMEDHHKPGKISKEKMRSCKSKAKQEPNMKCDVCGKCFRTTKGLTKHLKSHSNPCKDLETKLQTDETPNTSKESIVCQYCSEKFDNNKDLKAHIRVNHKNALQKKCEECDKVLSSLSAYRIHLRHHRDDRPYVCETCGKSFIQLVTLKEHALIHKGELPFKCPHCPHRSRQKQSLVVHMRIHTGERPYSCPLCSQTFTTSSNRAKHIRYHSDATPYHCEKCPKAYSYKEDLLDHISVVHIGVQRHQCQICLKRFSSNSSLIHHRRVEHNIKRKYAGVGKVPEYLRVQENVNNSMH